MKIRDQFAVKVGKGTRDPLSALYYVRTLSLKPGDEVTVPIIENARKLRVQVRATGMESIVAAGETGERASARAHPSLHGADRARYGSPSGSAIDERRVPVQMHVATDFGSFRGQLVSFRANP
jgi:hypothetical protein